MPQEPIVTYKEFSAKIKEKYPQYKDVDDKILAEKMVEKYPQYKDKFTFDEQTSVEGEGINFTNASSEPSEGATTTSPQRASSEQSETGGTEQPSPLVKQELPVGIAAPKPQPTKFDFVWEAQSDVQLPTAPQTEKESEQKLLEFLKKNPGFESWLNKVKDKYFLEYGKDLDFEKSIFNIDEKDEFWECRGINFDIVEVTPGKLFEFYDWTNWIDNYDLKNLFTLLDAILKDTRFCVNIDFFAKYYPLIEDKSYI